MLGLTSHSMVVRTTSSVNLLYLVTNSCRDFFPVTFDSSLALVLKNAEGCRLFRQQKENQVEFLVGPILPGDVLVECNLRAKRRRKRSGDNCAGRAIYTAREITVSRVF